MKISLLLGTLWPASTHGKQAQLLRILLKITCRSLPILFQNSILELLFYIRMTHTLKNPFWDRNLAFLIKNHYGRAIYEKTKEIQFKDIVVKKDISRIQIIKNLHNLQNNLKNLDFKFPDFEFVRVCPHFRAHW